MLQKLFNILKIIVIIILILIILFFTFFFYVGQKSAVPKNYVEKVKTGGKLEQKYLNTGKYKVEKDKIKINNPSKKIELFYPEELKESDKKYPVVLFVNGTGVAAKKYTEVFEHLASWGFIAIGNEDNASGKGDSSEQTISYLVEQNENKDSIFYHKIDTDNIGITGYSQGGAGMFNAITVKKHSAIYKTAVAVSPANEPLATKLDYPYDISKVTIPTLLLAGTGDKFETQYVIPIDIMNNMYDRLSVSTKVVARKIGKKHSETLYATDGYLTAWFMYYLQNDKEAGNAFFGTDAELKTNKLYQDVQIKSE